jgi:hypothetical protein
MFSGSVISPLVGEMPGRAEGVPTAKPAGARLRLLPLPVRSQIG